MKRLIKNEMVLYHGTIWSLFKDMLKDGYISNRNTRDKKAKLEIENVLQVENTLEVESVIQYDAIYLTTDFDYCKNFAENKANLMHDTPIILQLNINKDTHKLLPDEDIIQYFWYGNKTGDLKAIVNDMIIIKNKETDSFRGNHKFIYKNELVDNNFKNYAYVITDEQQKNVVKWFEFLLDNNIIENKDDKYEFVNDINILHDKNLNKLFNTCFSYKDSLKDILSLAIKGNIPTSVVKKINVGFKKDNLYIYKEFDKKDINLIEKEIKGV